MQTEDFARFGIDLASDQCRKPWDFSAEMLQRVSRTFALNIRVLPSKRLREPVLLAYLYLRMADTVEDCPTLPATVKQDLLARFSEIFSGDSATWRTRAESFQNALPKEWAHSQDDEEFLCAHASWSIALFYELSAPVQAPIVQCVREMCDGMAQFVLRQDSLQGQWLTISQEDDLDQYCYYVAGVVGILLCDLFYAQSRRIDEVRYQKMRSLAVSFGIALQVTNMVKDVQEDAERQVCFLPLNWITEAGFSDPAAMFVSTSLDQQRRVMAPMIRKAWRHLQDALDFTLLVPALEPRIRLFCLWPLLMSAETLVVVGDGTPVFAKGVKVKITRATVKRILQETTLRCWRSGWLRRKVASLRSQSLPKD